MPETEWIVEAGGSTPETATTVDERVAEATAAADAAAADAVQTGLNAIATAADRVQTGLDRAQTGADVVASAADVVSTAADRVQTGLDAIATAADRVQTGLDATATAADSGATSADAIATAADRVQTGLDAVATAADAGTATTQAGIATTKAGEASASAVATAADAIATAADRVQTGLDAVATAADRVQTGLDVVSTAADASATNADAIATAADRVQTGLDAVATAADRVATGLDATATAADAIATAADRVQTGLDADAAALAAGGMSRADAVTMIAGGWVPTNNITYHFGGLRYKGVTGSTEISDMPGLDPSGDVNVKHWGAVCDNATDDLIAFTRAAASNLYPVHVDANSYISVALPAATNNFVLRNGAVVRVGVSGTFFPRQKTAQGKVEAKTKSNPLSLNPTIPVEFYALLTDSFQTDDYWLNYWGYQEPDTDGNLSGANRPVDKMPPGQTRLARSGAYMNRWRGSHAGEGDGYNHYNSMFTSPHTRTGIVTLWGGQNSGGIDGGQNLAGGAKVNLYYSGDKILKDAGYQDVSLLGDVLYLYNDGGNSGDYHIPRVGYQLLSSGANEIGAAFVGAGPMYVGLDLSRTTTASGSAIAMADGHRISFDAALPTTANGEFHTQNVGTLHLGKGAGDTLDADVYGARFAVGGSFVSYEPTVDNGQAISAFSASSTTSSVSIGQIGTTGYLTSASTASANTALVLRTALAGATRSVMTLNSAGNLNMEITGSKIQFGFVPVLSARKTGWALASGTATRTGFNTATVTTSQLAERLKALIDDLASHGMIGA